MTKNPKTVPFAFYCTCGVSMVGRVSPASRLAYFQELWDSQGHGGDGHAPTDAKGAAAARRKQERATAKAMA